MYEFKVKILVKIFMGSICDLKMQQRFFKLSEVEVQAMSILIKMIKTLSCRIFHWSP